MILKEMLQYSPLDRLYQALGDPARRAMVERLTQGPASVSELAAPLDMSLAAVVQHVQALEQSGLVSTRKNGRVRTCTLDPDAISLAETWLSQRRQQWESHFDRLGALLAEPVPPKKERKKR